MKKSIIIAGVTGLFFSLSLLFLGSSDISDKNNKPSEYMSKYNIYALKIPNKLNFAKETVPMDLWYVKESFDRELMVNTYWQSQTLLFIKRANRYFPIIEKILRKEGVPEDFKYLALIESGFVPTIKSPAGAVGIWQFMPSTAREYGLEVNSEVDERYHVEKSTRAACRYLKKAYKKFNNWTLVAASYNSGMSAVSKQLKLQGAKSYYQMQLNPETGRYVYRILAIKQIMKNPKNYGFLYRKEDLYKRVETKEITINKPVLSFADFAKNNNITYKVLKELNPWLRRSYLKNTRLKTYQIQIPKDELNLVVNKQEKTNPEEQLN
ncbi:MAG: lytic transglycosylase domain-containing protein [Marinifilaceae bacterium]|jgi:hypothetical protein|nr:lytic transglycosylase domain-containing protein [Marinifilaceae bacterium]